MAHYTFITFAPVQGFIEKSRKLRDLYGASLILSYLSQQLIEAIHREEATVISPGLPNLKKGMPNRILLTGEFSELDAEGALIHAWSHVLKVCRIWIEKEVEEFRKTQNKDNYNYTWESEWDKWKGKTWEVFWGTGDSPETARKDLENRKLARRWTAINWIGESSSISGADAIAYPRMADEGIQVEERVYQQENQPKKGFPKTDPVLIKKFYDDLAEMFDKHKSEWKQQTENSEAEGKFIAANERLSIPELIKRLVTHYSVAKQLGIEPPQKFGDMIRRASNTGENIEGHWTGWFMGDGDKMGDLLQKIAIKYKGEECDRKLKAFSEDVRRWGETFQDNFFKKSDFSGRVIYAGGDNFLGVLYSKDPEKRIPKIQAYQFLQALHREWDSLKNTVQKKYEEPLTVSVGLVWVAPGVPQRDVLQHCREAEKRSKSLGRDRVTIRIVFNNGQYVQWTTPWSELSLLEEYSDREGNSNEKANWTHIYNDWAHLKSRHAIDLSLTDTTTQEDLIDEGIAMALFDLYFQQKAERISANRHEIVRKTQNEVSSLELIRWINDLICVGWQLCSDT